MGIHSVDNDTTSATSKSRSCFHLFRITYSSVNTGTRTCTRTRTCTCTCILTRTRTLSHLSPRIDAHTYAHQHLLLQSTLLMFRITFISGISRYKHTHTFSSRTLSSSRLLLDFSRWLSLLHVHARAHTHSPAAVVAEHNKGNTQRNRVSS